MIEHEGRHDVAVIDLARLDEHPPMRRAAALEIEPSWLLTLFRQIGRHGRLHRLDGLPDDARVVGVAAHVGRNTLTLYLESEEFPPCAPGAEPWVLQDLSLTTYTLSDEQRAQLDEWMGR